MQMDDVLIRVQAGWDCWANADVRVSDLRDLHWFHPIGAPQALVHGHISCSSLMAGEIPHQCDPGSVPHRLRVCILKRHNMPTVYAELARRADERSPGLTSTGSGSGVWRWLLPSAMGRR
jgi:hypothetical protein